MRKPILLILLITCSLLIGCGHKKSWVGYIENYESEIVDITPVHTGYNLKVVDKKGPEFKSEEKCKKRANGGNNKVCYNIDPNDWVGFYMGDSEPRPVFKTYEECEDWAISMMPNSFRKNAKGGVHVSEDGVTRCSQGCHYSYNFYDRLIRTFECNKTIYSKRSPFDYFEKVFDRLEEGWNYERFEKAFGNGLKTIGCDIIINNGKNAIYSYFVGIGHKIGIAPADINIQANNKIITKQKNIVNGKVFYIQQIDGLVYVRGDIYDKGIGTVYNIKNADDNIVFQNIKNLFENKNVEISCHNDFGTRSDSTWNSFYILPEGIEREEVGEIDNIFYRLN